MKIGDLLGGSDNSGPVADVGQEKSETTVVGHAKPDIPPPTEEELQALAEEAIQATDIARDTKAIAEAARRRLEAAMDAAGKRSVIALGRECPIKEDRKPDTTLKALSAVMGEDDAKKVWDKLPRKPYRRVEIPNSLTVEPED